jgi:hypothetical protein
MTAWVGKASWRVREPVTTTGWTIWLCRCAPTLPAFMLVRPTGGGPPLSIAKPLATTTGTRAQAEGLLRTLRRHRREAQAAAVRRRIE